MGEAGLLTELGIRKQDVLYDFEKKDDSGAELARFLVYREGNLLGVVSAVPKKASHLASWLPAGSRGYQLKSKYLIDLDQETINSIDCEGLQHSGILFETAQFCHHGAELREICLGVAAKGSAWLGAQEIWDTVSVTEDGAFVFFLGPASDTGVLGSDVTRLRLY